MIVLTELKHLGIEIPSIVTIKILFLVCQICWLLIRSPASYRYINVCCDVVHYFLLRLQLAMSCFGVWDAVSCNAFLTDVEKWLAFDYSPDNDVMTRLLLGEWLNTRWCMASRIIKRLVNETCFKPLVHATKVRRQIPIFYSFCILHLVCLMVFSIILCHIRYQKN